MKAQAWCRRMALRVAWVAALLVGAFTATAVAGASGEPIKIGVYTSLTGTFAQSGQDMHNGFRYFLDTVGGEIAGRKLNVIVEDTQGNPTIALQKVRKLVESDKVHILLGPDTAAEGYAVRDYVDSARVPNIFSTVSADDITQRRRTPYIIRTGWTSSQPSHPFGEWVYDRLGYRTVVTLSYDYAFGWEVVAGFVRTFTEKGGRVVRKIWIPVGTQDYAPYLAQIPPNVDAVFAIFSGGDAIRFMKQYREFGLKDRIPLIGGGALTDESVLKSMGEEALGVITPLQYSAALQTPEMRRFISDYWARYRDIPGYRAESAFTAGMLMKRAIESIGGEVENREALLRALRSVPELPAPRGPVRLDSYGNPVQNIYIRKVEMVSGRLQNTVIDTIPAVSQFWKYDPEQYLAGRAYSRDYP